MFCKFCGEKIEDGSIFCSKCGSKLTTDELPSNESVNDGKEEVVTVANETKATKGKAFIKKWIIPILAFVFISITLLSVINCDNNSSSSNSSSGSGSNEVSFYTTYSMCNCTYPWAEVGTDYLSIDTNPYDYDSDLSGATTYASSALSAIKSINSRLGLPSYLYEEMLETRALDGRQSYSGTRVNVSWRYHPDSGLEVRYTKK